MFRTFPTIAPFPTKNSQGYFDTKANKHYAKNNPYIVNLRISFMLEYWGRKNTVNWSTNSSAQLERHWTREFGLGCILLNFHPRRNLFFKI